GAGDGEHHFEGGKPHCPGEGRNYRAHSGEETADEQAGESVLLVELLDAILRVRSGVLLDSTQEHLGAEASAQRVGHYCSGKIADPSKEENREWRSVRPVGKETPECNYRVGWKRRKEILKCRECDYRSVKRPERRVSRRVGDWLQHSSGLPFHWVARTAGEGCF